MYQIVLKGYIETETPDEIIESINNIVKEKDSDLVGNFQTYILSPYVDYQKQED